MSDISNLQRMAASTHKPVIQSYDSVQHPIVQSYDSISYRDLVTVDQITEASTDNSVMSFIDWDQLDDILADVKT